MNPRSFPIILYNDIPGKFNLRALSCGSDPFKLGRQFTTAWYGVEYRWNDCLSCSEDYIEATKALIHPMADGTSDAGKGYEQYCHQQEKALFSFLYLGLSALETLVYGLFFLAARRYPVRFPINHRNGNIDPSLKKKALDYRQIEIARISKRFCEELPADPLSEALYRLRCDRQLKDWKILRNEFTHRMTPFRSSFVVNQAMLDHVSDAPMLANLKSHQGEFLEFTEGRQLRLDEKTTIERLDWLAIWLIDLIGKANVFIDGHYPKQ